MSKGNPLVTIATSMYKVEKYVIQCIESVLAQTYQNLEFIIVDDGSPDNSGKIADEYAQKDDRIVVVHQDNSGFGGGRNAAIDIAKGDYISFVDADDYLAPDFVEYMLGLITKDKAEIAISRNCFTTSNMTQVKSDSYETITSEEAVIEFFMPFIKLGAWNKIYDMDFIKRKNLRFVPELKTGEGLQFITNAAHKASKIAVGQKKVYVYRLNNPGSATTHANVEKQGIGSLETMEYIKQHLPLRSKKEEKAYYWHLWNCYRYCLRQIVDSKTENNFSDLYHKCKKELRKGALRILFSSFRIRLRIEALVVLASPVFYSRLQILKKRTQIHHT